MRVRYAGSVPAPRVHTPVHTSNGHVPNGLYSIWKAVIQGSRLASTRVTRARVGWRSRRKRTTSMTSPTLGSCSEILTFPCHNRAPSYHPAPAGKFSPETHPPRSSGSCCSSRLWRSASLHGCGRGGAARDRPLLRRSHIWRHPRTRGPLRDLFRAFRTSGIRARRRGGRAAARPRAAGSGDSRAASSAMHKARRSIARRKRT